VAALSIRSSFRSSFYLTHVCQMRGGERCSKDFADHTFGVDRATAVLHAVANRPLVHIHPGVINQTLLP
jgi:hypothetical protein